MPDSSINDLSHPVLQVEGIVRTFPGVKALGGVSFDVRPGEVHALVGENGAGKSTLMRVLCGADRPDEGRILVDGREVSLRTPSEATRLGIAMVYQDTRLVPVLNAPRNIFLGREVGGFLLDDSEMRSRSAELLQRFGIDIDLTGPVADKPLAERQLIEIARALATKARVLILDEPTSALTAAEVARLMRLIRDLRDEGTSVIFISHRLPEVFAISDVISVLKDGQMVGTVRADGATENKIVSMMVGRELSLTFPPRAEVLGAVALQVAGLPVQNGDEIRIEVRKGEILGLGGISGSGQEAMIRAMYGLGDGPADLVLDGNPVRISSPADAIRSGIVFVPADRRGEGMFLSHSIADNISLPHVRDWSRLGILDRRREVAEVDRQILSLRVRTPSARQPVEMLSGGNQQKVAFARWLLREPRLLILEEPTQGVDVGSKLEIYRLIRAMAGRGVCVVLISSDVQELIGLSDRILVVADRAIVDEMPAREATEQRIVGSAVAGATGNREVAPEAVSDRSRHPLLNRYTPTAMLVLLTVALCAYTAAQTPYFLTARNFSSLGIQVAPLLIAAMGQLAVILTRGIDLSIGPTISLATAISSWLLVGPGAPGLAFGIVAVLLAGLLVGLLNALLIEHFNLPDLIATLSTYLIVSGAALIVRPSPGGLVDFGFSGAVLAQYGGVPVAFAVALTVALLFELNLLRGRLGQRLYATGSSPVAAFVAGLPVKRIRVGVYVFSGMMAALAGIVVAARIGSGDPQSGTTFTLMSVTVVVLGGASVFGGRGTAIGVIFAAILLMMLQNAMNHLQVTAYWQYVVTGSLTLVAVAFYAAREPGGLLSAQRRSRSGQYG